MPPNISKHLPLSFIHVATSTSAQLEDHVRDRFCAHRSGIPGHSSSEPTAADIVNSASESQLAELIRVYTGGGERYSKLIAEAIVAARKKHGHFKTTRQLAAVVEVALEPKRRRHASLHPATLTFQALRICVNDEIEQIERGVAAALQMLRPGGRLAVLTFHSLEVTATKRGLARAVAALGPAAIKSSKPCGPSPKEIAANPRSRSARLRIVTRQG